MRLFVKSLISLTLFACCSTESSPEPLIIVSIQPLKYLAHAIVGDRYRIDVLVPPGSTPETYAPTPRQLAELESSEYILTTGLTGFEQSLVERLSDPKKVLSLSRNVPLISGSVCGSGHVSGTDPHIWLSPKALKIMTRNLYEALIVASPDSAAYARNYACLEDRLDSLDRTIAARLAQANITSFLIYHPALSYYARDYNLQQIAVEHEGKEPSAESLRKTIALGRKEELRTILYQKEFSRSVVHTVAADLGVRAVEIDPLAEDIPFNLLHITEVIADR